MNTYIIESDGKYLKFEYESAEKFKEDAIKTATDLEYKNYGNYEEIFSDGVFALAGIEFHYSSVLNEEFQLARIITLVDFLVEFFSEKVYDRSGYEAEERYLFTNSLGDDL